MKLDQRIEGLRQLGRHIPASQQHALSGPAQRDSAGRTLGHSRASRDYDTVAIDLTRSTPGFIGAFQIVSAPGNSNERGPLLPNSDVVAVRLP